MKYISISIFGLTLWDLGWKRQRYYLDQWLSNEMSPSSHLYLQHSTVGIFLARKACVMAKWFLGVWVLKAVNYISPASSSHLTFMFSLWLFTQICRCSVSWILLVDFSLFCILSCGDIYIYLIVPIAILSYAPKFCSFNPDHSLWFWAYILAT